MTQFRGAGFARSRSLALSSAVAMIAGSLSACGGTRESMLESKTPIEPAVAVGQLVQFKEGSSADKAAKIDALAAWADKRGADIRIVSRELGIAEVMGLSADEVAEEAADAVVQPNQYFPDLLQNVKSEVEALEAEVSAIRCVQRDDSIQIETGMDRASMQRFDRGVMNLGSGTASFRAREKNRVPVEITWKVRGPDVSNLNNFEMTGPTLDLNPDVAGVYYVLVMFAKTGGKCKGTILRFGVTYSEDFRAPTPARSFGPEDRALFPHLEVVKAEQAWATTKGRGVKIAVIDTGVSWNHPDLAQNIAVDSEGVPVSRNFWREGPNPTDDHGHGTHVAGLAASAVMGVAPEAKIIPIKGLNAMGSGDLGSLIAGVEFAGSVGADFINASFGGDSPIFLSMKEAIEGANAKGTLFLAAAGNGDAEGRGYNIDLKPTYPASITLPGLITIAATKPDGSLSSYSNFGGNTVHLAAPGGDDSRDAGPLNSAYYLHAKKTYVGQMGTSMATPVAAGVAALAKASHPGITNAQLRELLIASGTTLAALRGKVGSERLLDASVAVQPVVIPRELPVVEETPAPSEGAPVETAPVPQPGEATPNP